MYVDGRLMTTLKGDRIVAEFITILENYVASKYGSRQEADAALTSPKA